MDGPFTKYNKRQIWVGNYFKYFAFTWTLIEPQIFYQLLPQSICIYFSLEYKLNYFFHTGSQGSKKKKIYTCSMINYPGLQSTLIVWVQEVQVT